MSGTELAIVLVAIIVGAIAKAVTGMGLPLIVIPVAALFADLDDAVVVIGFPNVLANGVLVWRERRHRHETRDLPALATTGVAGAVVGAVVFVNAPEEPLVVLLVVAIIGYVATFLARPDLRVEPDRSKRLAPAVGAVAGGFQGAIGISGPIVGSWIHSYRLTRGAHIFSVTSLFFITGAAQLAVFVAAGEYGGDDRDRIVVTLLACIPVLASIPLGTWIRERVSPRGFDLAVVGMLAVSAVALCVQTFV